MGYTLYMIENVLGDGCQRFMPPLPGVTDGPWAYRALGGYVPAMPVTEDGGPLLLKPDNGVEFWRVLVKGTERK